MDGAIRYDVFDFESWTCSERFAVASKEFEDLTTFEKKVVAKDFNKYGKDWTPEIKNG